MKLLVLSRKLTYTIADVNAIDRHVWIQMKQFISCFKRSDTDVIVAKLFVLTRNECVASPNPTVTNYYFVRKLTCSLLRYCYRPSSEVCPLSVCQSVSLSQ